jgi:uncharacterized protein (TIGR02284 family)
MSDRTDNLNEIVALLEAGEKFYTDAAEKIEDTELVETFRAHAAFRQEASAELKEAVQKAGAEPASPSLRERAREAYARLTTLVGDTRDRLIAALEEHEDRTLAAYRKAMGHEANAEDKEMLEAQFDRFKAAHDKMRALKEAA